MTHAELMTGVAGPISGWEYSHWQALYRIEAKERELAEKKARAAARRKR